MTNSDFPMEDFPRLIEHAFPLRQASVDSVHEKNVRHGHISTLHIWPARRPLAASRAALLATLLPDPGTPEKRRELCEKIGGKLVEEKDDEGRIKDATAGGILHWKRETENRELLDELRAEIRKAYGGRAPRVLDPFSGGGAIPLEAMRLGCEVTAADLNPVAWFILKCTLEYPQKLAGQTRPLPEFILRDRDFMESFLKKVYRLKGAKLRKKLEELGHRTAGEKQDEWDFDEAATAAEVSLQTEIGWHIRAWGRLVLAEARNEIANQYPIYADWQPLKHGRPFEPQPRRLVDPDAAGQINARGMNAESSDDYLADSLNPRWVPKPAAAYLWARTVKCKNCRTEIPLLKTRWLCKKENKRIRLVIESKPDGSGVTFSIDYNVPERGGNSAQKREYDKKIGGGTMTRAGVQCPCCPALMETEDIRYEGRNGRLGQTMTAVVVDGPNGKEYRLPTDLERAVADINEQTVRGIFENVPFGLPEESLPPKETLGFRVPLYGFDQWRKLYTNRQLVTLGTFCKHVRDLRNQKLPNAFRDAISGYLALAIDRMANRGSTQCIWNMPAEKIEQTFARFALPVLWDFAESNPLGDASGNFQGETEWVALVYEHIAATAAGSTSVLHRSATKRGETIFDLIVTDPPYYDAIPYSDLMDFFYVWLRRTLHGLNQETDNAFAEPLAPKWNHETRDGELIDDSSRHDGDKDASRKAYEDGMARAFKACHSALASDGRFVVVFAHKHPDAWEALVSAIIRAGFVVDGSWPIVTERSGRMRANASAALASSVWLVCRKRDPLARAGWDNRVMAEMRENIGSQLREFWDAGIRGPDFVWAATGPAMEAYSKYPAVKKANSPAGDLLKVSEFLEAVRRIVVEFVVGRVLRIESEANAQRAADRLDPVTSYYLLHRNDFRFGKAPAGACILYSVSCGLSDADLERTWNLIKVKGSTSQPEEELDDAGETESEDDEDSDVKGGEFVLRTWKERNERRMGYEAPGGREVPMIDRVHRLMHLWREGEVRKVDDYLDENALRGHELFSRVIQSLIELSDRGSEERSLLESLSSHLRARAPMGDATRPLPFGEI